MPPTKRASAELGSLIRILERMSALSTAILQAGIAGNEVQTRENVDRLRQEKSALNHKNSEMGKELKHASAATLGKIQELINIIAKSEHFVKAWCTRYRGTLDHQTMMNTPEGCHDLIDEIMPAVWDWHNDILIIPNWVTPLFVEILYLRGQKRVCVFDFEEHPTFPRNTEPFHISCERDAFEYFNKSQLYHAARIEYISIATPIELQNEIHFHKAHKLLENFKMAFVHRIAGLNTVKLQGARLLNQGLTNLPAIADATPFSKMIGVFEGVPMLIASPGPSLDKNIHQLKHFKERALIVAPAQSALALTSAGVIPDVVVIADPNEMQYLLEGVPMHLVPAVLLGVTCHPTLYQKYAGKIITFNANQGLDTWISDIFQDTIKLPAGGSVSTDALCMGVYLKCSPIIIVGQDLSFTDDQQYARQSADGRVKIVKDEETNTISYANLTEGLETVLAAGGFDSRTFTEPVRTLPGYYGGTVFTKTDYWIFHSEFQNIAKAVKDEGAGVELLNCTEGGAYIEGFRHISLEEANRLLRVSDKTFDISAIMKSILGSKDVLVRREKLVGNLTAMRSNLHAARLSAARCRQLTRSAMHSGLSDRLAVEEKRLIAIIQKTLFISLAAQEKIIHAMKVGAEAQSLTESFAASNMLFKIVTEVVDELIPSIDLALSQLSRSVTK